MPEGQDPFLRKGNLHAIDELTHQEMVADQQSIFHRPGRNLEGLDHKGANDQGKDKSDNDRLCPLPALRFGRF
jgi:hypothetical protein